MLLGIEIGGTKLQACLADSHGTIHQVWRTTVDPQLQADGIRAAMLSGLPELVARLPAGQKIRGIGVGFGGPVDARTGTTIISHQIHGWEQFPLAEWLHNLLGVDAIVVNDADVAGLGEATRGAERRSDSTG